MLLRYIRLCDLYVTKVGFVVFYVRYEGTLEKPEKYDTHII